MNPPRLRPLAEILPRAFPPLAARMVAPAASLGAIAAAPVIVPEGWPRTHVAREPGYAVETQRLIGATAYEPALLAAATPRLAAGEAVPPGADAMLPAHAVSVSPLGLEVYASPGPGEGLRRAGQDWPASRPVLEAGAAIGATEQALLIAMGLPSIPVRRAAISLAPDLPGAIRALLAGWAGALGLAITGPAEADLRLEAGAMAEARLALRPGRFGDFAQEDGHFRLAIPPDLTEATGLWHALLLPVLARLSGAQLSGFAGVLAGKLVSGIGFGELAFLRRAGEAWQPIETGDCTFATLAATEAVALIAPGAEGHAAGDTIALMPLGGAFATMRDRSFTP